MREHFNGVIREKLTQSCHAYTQVYFNKLKVSNLLLVNAHHAGLVLGKQGIYPDIFGIWWCKAILKGKRFIQFLTHCILRVYFVKRDDGSALCLLRSII